MNPRILAAGIFSVFALLFIAALLGLAAVASSASSSVWVMQQPVLAGSKLTASDVTTVSIHGASASFVALTQDPVGQVAAVNLATGDLLVPQDIEQGTAYAEVQIQVKGIGATAGNKVNIFYFDGSDSIQIGWAVPVEAGSGGGDLNILVPAVQQADWVAVSNAGGGTSNGSLTVALTNNPTPAPPANASSTGPVTVSTCEAITALSPNNNSTVCTSPSPTP